MSQAADFLRSLGNLLSTSGLYGPEHPVVRKNLDTAFGALRALLGESRGAVFSFIEDDIVFNDLPLTELGGWSWSRRFAEAEIQRLEITPAADAAEFQGFLAEIGELLQLQTEAYTPGGHPHIRFGHLGFRGSLEGDGGSSGPGQRSAPLEPGVALRLDEEADAVRWIHDQAFAKGAVPWGEAAVVVRGLRVAMLELQELAAPFLKIHTADSYTAVHCLNVALLSMALAEYLNFSDAEVRAVGEAGLLHDMGKTGVPEEILGKKGSLTAEERLLIERHPIDGARVLIGETEEHALAAVVAYEHHMHWNGEGGYPTPHYPRKPHRFSRVVQICDVFDALRTKRPFRPPLTAEAALAFLRERSGSEFDPELCSAFLNLMDELDSPIGVEQDGGQVGGQDGEESTFSIRDELATVSAAPFDADMEQDPVDG